MAQPTSAQLYEKYQKFNIPQIIEQVKNQGWKSIGKTFLQEYAKFEKMQTQEKAIFTDLFFGYCLNMLEFPDGKELLWEIAGQWYFYRKLPPRCGGLPGQQFETALYFCVLLQGKAKAYFSSMPLSDVRGISQRQEHTMLTIWRQIFLNAFSPLNLVPKNEIAANSVARTVLTNTRSRSWYPQLILGSIAAPVYTGDIQVDIEKLWGLPDIPLGFKGIIIFWLISIPYYNAVPEHREKMLGYVSRFCRAAVQKPEFMSRGFFNMFLEEAMSGLWRAAYVGGNNLQELSDFGDFIHFFMKRFYPQFSNVQFENNHKRKKIRIGYISRNFCNQAVSCYMVNRIIYHDSTSFEVYTFALGDRADEMTGLFRKHSDKFIRFTSLNDVSGMAQQIVDSQLDMLIYADIGMDPITYMLSGLQLAPVQGALVGHGTTTGMPTIQYYLSGDFEPYNADKHYREQLIRLPNLGAAQHMPGCSTRVISRKKLGIPDDAVVFISCANGIKHGETRDRLLIEILRQVPNAWIILKPFQNPQSVNNQLAKRIAARARAAGVNNRLLILPPLPHSQDVMSLLVIADVQLDTYPYGGWTTNMEALYMGLPVVTQQGAMMRNRWGGFMLRALGICEGIARDEPEYIAWAVRLGRDAELRQRLRKKIQEKVKAVLFNGEAAQKDYETLLKDIASKANAQTSGQCGA